MEVSNETSDSCFVPHINNYFVNNIVQHSSTYIILLAPGNALHVYESEVG